MVDDRDFEIMQNSSLTEMVVNNRQFDYSLHDDL
jgi:hypothetical protein